MHANNTDLAAAILPADAADAILIGRVWDVKANGPRPIAVHGTGVHDLTRIDPTVSGLLERADRVDLVREVLADRPNWDLHELLDASLARDSSRTRFISPVDLQAVKACGVTFVDSMIERVIEERVGGDPARAIEMRAVISDAIGSSLAELRPGSPAAVEAKRVLQEQGLWSQYLEVGIGPDPEVFSKAPVLSTVGLGAEVGVTRDSRWNNPEPELVLVVTSTGDPVGATLGNDVNLRDIEGRSALLLGKAKDNNASASIGPFVRLFDGAFGLDDLRNEEITLRVDGNDGFHLEGRNSLCRISRPFEELIRATLGDHHQYPDGFVLYTGTLFAPTDDRDAPGEGFTHKPGDEVSISSPQLGALRNTVGISEDLPPWTFGIGAMIRHLAGLQPAAAPRRDLDSK